MSEENKNEITKFEFNPDKSDSDDSEWGLEIVIKSTPKRRRKKSIDEKDKEIIESFEKNYGEALEEKAAKSNLSHSTVKSILKHVFTDEHILALVKQKEGCEEVGSIIPYEPKFTRSKAKQLLSDAVAIPVPWQSPHTSEVQALLTEDLQEDSSGDEYVPGEEESEDDTSFACTASNASTPHRTETTPNHSFNDDEIFKTPQPKLNTQHTEKCENIALRTRSKLSLSQTPLEKIEQAFMPPDITTDMYEMDCKDEDWKEFLKSFTKPLEEVVKCTEDEDHDPEYNILSDEEIDTVDKEELRADKAVKVPKKELNDLMAELFEYVDIYSKETEQNEIETNTNIDVQQQLLDNCLGILDATDSCYTFYPNSNCSGQNTQDIDDQSIGDFSQIQLILLREQMCQHVQLLTQNFLLMFEHSEFGAHAFEMKELLFSLKYLSEGKENSVFKCVNLENALALIEKWQELFCDADEEAIETKKHFDQTMQDSIEAHSQKKHLFLPFPPLILETISNSDVFMYPNLLPQIPYKHPKILETYTTFMPSENSLIALGLQQFIPHFSKNKEFLTPRKELNMKKISELICSLLLPGKQVRAVYRQIIDRRKEKDPKNPISYYFMNQKAPLTLHQLHPLEHQVIVPPSKRPPELLPRQWRAFIWPDRKETKTEVVFRPEPALVFCEPKKEIAKPPPLLLPKPGQQDNKHSELLKELGFIRPGNRKRKFLEHKFKKCFRSNIPYIKYHFLRSSSDYSSIMLPSMPCLGISFSEDKLTEDSNGNAKGPVECTSEELEQCKEKSDDTNIKESTCTGKEKDNVEEINALMVASTTVKKEKKEISTMADKKRAKKKKEYLASLAMLSPPDPEVEKDRREQFAQAYFEKLKDTLHSSDYVKFQSLLYDADLKNGNAVDLYLKINPILSPKYQDLADEFLLFLNSEQANAVGKLIPFFIMNHMVKFIRNLEIYFKEQPSQLKKVYKSFSELNDTPGISLEKIKSTVLPLLKGNPLLSDSFLQLFLEESPTATLLNGAWELIDVNKELGIPDDEAVFESITVEDSGEDPCCPCSCHKIEEQSLKQHCIKCGIRFIQGKIYCQTGKGLKPVKLSFPFDPDIDHNARLVNQNKIKKSDPTTGKRLNSPSKEHQDENKPGIESGEDDKKRNSKGSKTPIAKKAKQKPKKSSVVREKDLPNKSQRKESPKKDSTALSNKSNTPKRNRARKIKIPELVENEVHKNEEVKAGASSGQLKRLANDDMDWKSLPSPEYLDIHSSDSELSQDEYEPTIDVKKETNTEKESCNIWTREEDKILLETFQQESDQDAIQLIAGKLKNRSVNEIKFRFERLMALLQEMEST